MATIALVDCNSFYCSVESNSLFRPDLIGKSVVVASNNDGAVVARNPEAKALGIKMGEPLFKISDLIREKGVVVFSSNYALYANMSARVMRILGEFSPECAVYSIDEAFLNLDGISRDLTEIGAEIRSTIKKRTGLGVGVGISSSCTLAKLANHAAKKYAATGGVVDLTDPARQRRLMAITPVGDVWGIGSKTEAKLLAMGIETALQLAESDPIEMRRKFNINMAKTIRELRGECVIPLELAVPPNKQIVFSRSFGKPVSEKVALFEAVNTFTVKAMEKLRSRRLAVNAITVFMHTSPYKDGYVYDASSVQFARATDNYREVIKAACGIVDAIWRHGNDYVKAGVMLLDLEDSTTVQKDFLIEENFRESGLMDVIDQINAKTKGLVFFGGQGVGSKQWHVKRGHLSPSYLTRWDDIPVVR
jgi:DNA polymerase V